MTKPELIKTAGYGVSTLSVILLGVPAWKNAATNPPIMLCLLGGMAASITGMWMWWWSYKIDGD